VPKLVIFRGDAVESEIRLTGNIVRVGRHERNDVVLDDGLNGVSRFHAEIRPEGNAYCIVDLNSRNGVWVNGRRIKERAQLALGVPATVGAFELALEDDISGTDFQAAAVPATAVGVSPRASASRQTGSAASATRPRQAGAAARTTARNPAVLWSAAAAAFVLLCLITYAIFKYSASKPAQTVAQTTPPATAVEQPPPPTPPTKTAEEIARERSNQDLVAARELIAAGQPDVALREHVQPVLERDPDNADAQELKRQAEQLIARPVKAPPRQPAAPVEREIEGITRRPNEPYDDYQARAKRLQAAILEGKNALDKQDYATAVARFRMVNNDQPRYMGADGLLADAVDKQRLALQDALNSGQLNEQAGRLKTARQWYQKAEYYDPTSTAAKEKEGSLLATMKSQAEKLLNQAGLAAKAQDTQLAIRLYQQVLDLMSPGDEFYEKARKENEALKK